MNAGLVKPKRKPARLRLVMAAGVAGLALAGSPASATDRRSDRPIESIDTRAAGEPIMAIVSLQKQRIRFMTTAAGSCGRRYRAARPDARLPPGFSA
jgi:hypothetical protein